MKQNIDYISLVDIAKLNLTNLINNKMLEYKKTPNSDLKNQIINLLKDKKQLFLFNKNVIEKYL